MRRKEKELEKLSDIEAVIHSARVCRIAMSDENKPYIIPMNFGYKDRTLYLHSAREGKKIDILKKNSLVCFEIDINTKIIPSEKACGWGMQYRSVIGSGTAVFLEDQKERTEALNIIISQYSGRTFEFDPKALDAVAVIRIDISEMSGKQSGF